MATDPRHDKLLRASHCALRSAAHTAIERGERTGTPVYIWQDEKPVDLLETANVSDPEVRETPTARVAEEPEA